MNDQPSPENNSTREKAGWLDLFRDGRAPYTILLNLGISLHAIDIFIITTIMPTVVEDIGGISYYAWTSMLYMVGDGIEYQDKKNKSKGYKLVDGDPVTGVKIPLEDHTGKSKVPPNRTIQQ